MQRAAVWVVDPARQEAVTAQFDGTVRLDVCDSVEAVDARAGSGEIGAVVVDLDGGGDRLGAALRTRAKRLPIIAWFTPTPARFRLLPPAFASGAWIECALRTRDIATLVHAVLALGARPGPAAHIIHRLAPLMPASLQHFLIACAIYHTFKPDVSTAITWIGVSRKALQARLRNARLPSPVEIHHLVKMLQAAWLLDEADLRPIAVAAAMKFPSLKAFSRFFSRYAGRSPQEFRQRGNFGELLEEVAARLGEGRERRM